MKYTPFSMERWQSTHEHRVELNLSESGVHPMTVAELMRLAGLEGGVDDIRLTYGQSNGSDLLRERIAALYPGADDPAVIARAVCHVVHDRLSAEEAARTAGQTERL